MSKYAPVVLFVYARPEHTRQTLNALEKNTLASKTDLIVYSDGARNESDSTRVESVRDLVRKVGGFRTVKLIERNVNYGLAKNIMDGVTSVCNEYGKVIVVEDDIVTTPGFLSYMNCALDRYKGQAKVWHISGWSYPIEQDGLPETYFLRVMNCWGWGTWKDRWDNFEKAPEKLVASWSRSATQRFNLDGAHDFWAQVTDNVSGKINTWAIFWYASIFERSGLCLFPRSSYVKNVGFDGSGENCSVTDVFGGKLEASVPKSWAADYVEEELANKRVRKFYGENKKTFGRRVLGVVKRLLERI